MVMRRYPTKSGKLYTANICGEDQRVVTYKGKKIPAIYLQKEVR